MAFEKFFRTKTQEMLDKRKKDVPEVDDKRTFVELIEALQLAEDKIIHLEIEISAKKQKITELEHSKYGGQYIGGQINPEALYTHYDYGFQAQQAQSHVSFDYDRQSQQVNQQQNRYAGSTSGLLGNTYPFGRINGE